MSEQATLVLRDRPAPGVLRLTLNRMEARNALSTPMRQALAEAFRQAADDEQTNCILVTGGERVFAAGADLKEIKDLGPAGVHRLQVLRYWKAIADCPKPLVAAVAGPALGGGCELALHADVIVAARSAIFGLPEINLGIMPGGGATQRLVRAIGLYRAMKLLLTGESVPAEEAWRLGMASEVVDDAALMNRAVEIAAVIASHSSLALQMIKEVSLAGSDASLATGLMLERRSFEVLFDTTEQKNAMSAFLERRKSTPRGA
jgi:enoyl-CoA hydratase/carnithine racemase